MLTMIAIVAVRPGLEAAFEGKITRLFESVAAEPGCRGVTWGPSETAGEYVLVERYSDVQALTAHRTSEHIRTQGPGLAAVFARPLTLAIFTEQREL